MKWSNAIVIILLLALVGGCSSGNRNSGSTSQTVTVTISPSVANVVPNASLQLTASVTGTGTVAIVANTGAVRAGNIVTITTSTAHGFLQGQAVTISGVSDFSFNGVFTISSVPSTTTFTYAQTGTDVTSGGGTALSNAVTWSVNDVAGGNSTVGTISTSGVYTAPSTLPPPTTLTIAATSGVIRSNNIVTVTTTANHNLSFGQTVIIAGVTDTSFNGTFTVLAAVSPTQFLISQNGSDATSGGGTVSTTAVTVKATSVSNTSASGTAKLTIDSGISISVTPRSSTIGLTQVFQFNVLVTAPPGIGTGVNWQVNNVTGGSTTTGTISTLGVYTAPAALPSPATVSVTAVSQVDATRTSTVTVILSSASAPTLVSLSPTTVPEGAVFQDIYLTGTNFLSTATVRVNGTGVPSTFITTSLMRARLPASVVSTPGTVSVDVQPQTGAATAAILLNIISVRPALVGTSPDSAAVGSGTVDVNFNGGFYSPGVTTEFNGITQPSVPNTTRQRTVTLSAALLGTAGLFPIAVRNAASPLPLAMSNLAIHPTVAPSTVATLPVGTTPSAVAINSATGIAVIANRGSNNVNLIDLSTNTVSGPFGLGTGTSPTGVAVDSLRNIALVANNGSNNLTVLNATTGALITNIGGFGTLKPVSVGISPQAGLGVVAFESTNVAAIIDLNTNAIVSAAGVNNGASPQIGIEPRLNWALITPGGTGSLSIVDLNRRSTTAITATGVVRTSNIVTVTTAAAHGLAVGQAVFISGVTDASFNGIFSVSTLPSSTSFTFTQTAANATSGGGSVSSTSIVATVNLGGGVRGVAVNPETEQAFFCDSATSVLNTMSLMDQTFASVVTEAGNVATAVNPLTNIGVVVNLNTDEASVIDLRAPFRLHRIGVGIDPRAVAIDPGSNLAVIANEGSGNVTILNLGAIRPLHVTQVSPLVSFTSATPVNITVHGFGFLNGADVRLDETSLGTTVFVSSRVLTATVPASLLTGPRRFALDVVNPGGARTNVTDFAVYQAVTVGTAPRGVAIDPGRNIAVVANNGSANASIVNLATGTVTATVATGNGPEGVALLPRASRAIVANSLSNNASVIDLAPASPAKLFDVSTGTDPRAVAINVDDGTAAVANAGSNSVTFFSAESTIVPTINSVAVQAQPSALAFDVTRNYLAVTHSASNTLQIYQFGTVNPSLVGTIQGFQLPSGVIYDPVADLFVVVSSLSNNLGLVNPATLQATSLRGGINPSSIAYNVNTATLVTVNFASRSMTIIDFVDRRVRAILPLAGVSPRFAVDIHPFTNIAVVTDEINNRVILIPLPR